MGVVVLEAVHVDFESYGIGGLILGSFWRYPERKDFVRLEDEVP